jgi:hypothetical protein
MRQAKYFLSEPLNRTYTILDKSRMLSTSYINGGIGAAIPQ